MWGWRFLRWVAEQCNRHDKRNTVHAMDWLCTGPAPARASHIAGVTKTCDRDSRFYALCLHGLAMPALNMDAQLDAASTSDADERELLEAADFDSYWDRVMARSHFDSHRRHPPNASSDHGDDM